MIFVRMIKVGNNPHSLPFFKSLKVQKLRDSFAQNKERNFVNGLYGSSKSFLIFLSSIGAMAIIYINFMMGVYRGLIEKANSAMNQAQSLQYTQDAAVKAVFPFNDLDVITFEEKVARFLNGFIDRFFKS